MVSIFDPTGAEVAHGGDTVAGSLWASELVQAARRGKTGVDLASLGGRVYVIAAAPIVAQTYPSRPAGVLVFAQAVTDGVLESVNRFTGGQGRLSVYTGGTLSASTSPAEASPAATFRPTEFAAGQVFTEGDFTNKLVPLRDKSGQTVAYLKVSVRRDAFAAALGEINAITIARVPGRPAHRRRDRHDRRPDHQQAAAQAGGGRDGHGPRRPEAGAADAASR